MNEVNIPLRSLEKDRGKETRDSVETFLSEYESKLKEYTILLASYGGKIRLTGPSDPEVLWNEHILDCLVSVPFLPKSGRLIDVGSGGGLPGVVWAICRSDLQITLLDSVRKKCVALREMTEALGLRNVEIVCARCEEYALKVRDSFDLASARAVASTDILLEYLAPFVARKGRVVAFKGPHYAEELLPMEGKWSRLGLSAPEVFFYSAASKDRYLLLWKKEAVTPSAFPRKTGLAEKNKWWR